MSSPKKKQVAPTREDLIRRAEIELDGDTLTLRASIQYEVPPEQVTSEQRDSMRSMRSFDAYMVDNRKAYIRSAAAAVVRQ